MIECIPVKFIKSPTGRARLVVQMPLSDVIAAVTCVSENLAKSYAAVVQAAEVSRSPCRVRLARGEASNPCLRRVKARHQGSAARAAAGGVVERLEPDPSFGKCVDVGGVDLTSVATQIRVAKIVKEDDDDIGAVCPSCERH